MEKYVPTTVVPICGIPIRQTIYSTQFRFGSNIPITSWKGIVYEQLSKRDLGQPIVRKQLSKRSLSKQLFANNWANEASGNQLFRNNCSNENLAINCSETTWQTRAAATNCSRTLTKTGCRGLTILQNFLRSPP
jgi:hypothetical protein